MIEPDMHSCFDFTKTSLRHPCAGAAEEPMYVCIIRMYVCMYVCMNVYRQVSGILALTPPKNLCMYA